MRVKNFFSRFHTTEQINLNDVANRYRAGILKNKKVERRSKSHTNLLKQAFIKKDETKFKIDGGAVAL